MLSRGRFQIERRKFGDEDWMSKKRRKNRSASDEAREPNGRLSRKVKHRQARQAESERQAMEVALTARMNIFGLSEGKARDQKAATAIGRLSLNFHRDSPECGLSPAQYDALVKYQEVRRAFKKAVLSRMEGSQGGSAARGMEDSPEYIDWCQRAIERHDAMMARVQEAQHSHEGRRGNLYAALDYMVERDEYHRHMEGDLRLAANALARFFVIEDRYAA
jgi:hypothetical protein